MPNRVNQPLSHDIKTQIANLLGREPRGLEDVAVYGPAGEPVVIRVCSLVDGAPFPNLFWLVDRELVYRIDGDEAGGLIHRLQQEVDSSEALQREMIEDHVAHIELRNSFMTPVIEAQLCSSGYYEVLQQRGIGGIADFGRIRCLHTWYASHCVVPNTIGRLLDQYWAAGDVDERCA